MDDYRDHADLNVEVCSKAAAETRHPCHVGGAWHSANPSQTEGADAPVDYILAVYSGVP